MPRHPAKYSPTVLHEVQRLVAGFNRVLDPFAGPTGCDSSPNCVGVEIEPEWATHERSIVGDATSLPFKDCSFDAVATSPCYGNRMADHHDARDLSRRHTYRHSLGRPLNDRSSGKLQWGKAYREFHEAAWTEVHRVLRPFGIFVLNVSDHVRAGQVQLVTDWHRRVIEDLDFCFIDELIIETPRMRHGENYQLRVDHESILVFLRRAGLPHDGTTIAQRLAGEGRGPL